MIQTDLIIIGAGPGGYETASRAAEKGLNTVIIEKEALGGTCLNAGCIPTKCLCRNAEILDYAKDAATYGINLGDVNFNFQSAIERKNEVVEKLKNGIGMLLKSPGITLVHGEAKLLDKNHVEVNGEQYSASHIIIATGSITKFLPIEGAHVQGVVTSTEMLNLEKLPERLCIIGGGVIGMEFASIFNSFGSNVEVIEFCKEILPPFDRDIAKRLRTTLKKKGINFHLSSAAKAIHPGECLNVEFEEKGKSQSIETDLVLMAVGRVPNLNSINLDDIGIDYTPKGIKVNNHMQTNVPNIYAIGDINGLCQLAHAATFQGYAALEHILGDDTHYADSLKVIPSAVFTNPEAAMVGKTEESLTEEGITYKTYKSFFRANGKALSMNEEEGIVKVLVDENGQIVGAHILGAHASDLIHEIAIMMQNKIPFKELLQTIHAHPSLSEVFLSMK
jgi:dihydrolipoamide dehydrogenase